MRCARGKRLNGRLAILSMRHDGTGTAECKLRDLGIQIVILYEQNAQALERITIARIRANCLRNLGAFAFLERQADGKRRPLPQDARKTHGSAHKLHQLFCDRRAQASSRRSAFHLLLLAAKRLVEVPLELLAHANTVVGDRVFIDGDAIRWLHLAARQANIAALAVVLDGIAGNIEQQALEVRHAHPRIGMIKRLLVADNCHQTLLGLALQNIAHFTVEGHQIYGHEVQVDLPALQATHIECLVGKVEQQSRCRPDF